MDGRTRLVVGGVSAVSASVAVVCAVAMTTTWALADSAGSSLGAARVLVPAVVPPTPVTGADSTERASSLPPQEEAVEAPPVETVEAPDEEAVESPQAETVEAPDPVVVDNRRAAPTAPAAPAAPPAGTAPADPPAPASPAAPAAPAGDDMATAGAWGEERQRATERGWSPARIEAWLTSLAERYRAQSLDGAPADAPPLPPAHAGSNVDDRWNAPDADAKKDQSRDSPVARD